MTNLDDYLHKLAPVQKQHFERVRKVVQSLAPDAEELISYGVPTFKYQGRPLVYFGAFPKHMSIYPASDDMIKAIPELEAFRTGKGTLQFTQDTPLSDGLLHKIVAFRLKMLT